MRFYSLALVDAELVVHSDGAFACELDLCRRFGLHRWLGSYRRHCQRHPFARRSVAVLRGGREPPAGDLDTLARIEAACKFADNLNVLVGGTFWSPAGSAVVGDRSRKQTTQKLACCCASITTRFCLLIEQALLTIHSQFSCSTCCDGRSRCGGGAVPVHVAPSIFVLARQARSHCMHHDRGHPRTISCKIVRQSFAAADCTFRFARASYFTTALELWHARTHSHHNASTLGCRIVDCLR